MSKMRDIDVKKRNSTNNELIFLNIEMRDTRFCRAFGMF
jgi:hypothetical protein